MNPIQELTIITWCPAKNYIIRWTLPVFQSGWCNCENNFDSFQALLGCYPRCWTENIWIVRQKKTTVRPYPPFLLCTVVLRMIWTPCCYILSPGEDRLVCFLQGYRNLTLYMFSPICIYIYIYLSIYLPTFLSIYIYGGISLHHIWISGSIGLLFNYALRW